MSNEIFREVTKMIPHEEYESFCLRLDEELSDCKKHRGVE